MKNNRIAVSLTTLFTGILLISSILIASASYFNNKEIEALTSKCHQNTGEPTLEIHNKLTHHYSFTCNMNEG